MLEVKNLFKIYRPKKGVPVTALNGISLKFPEKGMVFLLGKSGSGKSTLLNVLGGLDSYDNGEILIKGVSSKDFKQQHFDSYRNTYVGFIFQEYNVLDEFNVGANIALAIELQGRKATDSEINNILREVDLEGYGNRKPNELSGGQKQRVSIARALVKNPEIIMADEPTGALDSNTGKQIFNTLKKLSLNKLVIVVSHDRDFAEQYADRIIELADGSVINDVEVDHSASEVSQTVAPVYNANTVTLPIGYHLTEQDRQNINMYIDSLKSGNLQINISKIQKQGSRFRPTDQNKIIQKSGADFKLIKSKLPLKNAFKMGASGLKHKKIRLFFTILLSCIAFGLFGLADTFGSYNHIKTCTNSIIDSDIKYASVYKSVKVGSGVNEYWAESIGSINNEDITKIERDTGIKMCGIFTPRNADLSFDSQIDDSIDLSENEYSVYSTYFTGFSEINETVLNNMNCKIVSGRLPDGSKNEIAISKYVCETFKKANYLPESYIGSNTDFCKITDYSDMVGKTLKLNETIYTITGIVDTNLDLERYLTVTKNKEYASTADKLIDFALFNEFQYASNYSMASVIMLGEGYLNSMIAAAPKSVYISGYIDVYDDDIDISPRYIGNLSNIGNQNVEWIGEPKSSLSENEIIITSDTVMLFNGNSFISDEDDSSFDELKKNNGKFHLFASDGDEYEEIEGITVVGVIRTSGESDIYGNTIYTSDSLFEKYKSGDKGIYNFAVGAMPKSKDDIKKLVEYCYRTDSNTRYELQNSVTYELNTVNSILKALSSVFLYIGIGFAVFAAIMLANFIGTSIAYKKQEIGILRAIGSRSSDVVRIFFSESLIIAAVNFILSSTGVFVATTLINSFIRNEAGILVTVLNFGPRQILLLLAVSIFIAFIASFLPVKKIASKKPIDAIRNK